MCLFTLVQSHPGLKQLRSLQASYMRAPPPKASAKASDESTKIGKLRIMQMSYEFRQPATVGCFQTPELYLEACQSRDVHVSRASLVEL